MLKHDQPLPTVPMKERISGLIEMPCFIQEKLIAKHLLVGVKEAVEKKYRCSQAHVPWLR